MKIGGELGYRLLCWLKPGMQSQHGPEPAFSYIPKIMRVVGNDGWESLKCKTIIDFGCGYGAGCVELAQHGAKHVIGLDIRPDVLDVARASADKAGVSASCTFTDSVKEPVDVIISIDAFEHYDQPEEILRAMDRLLLPDGFVIVSFGPTWYHPHGGHLFSVFPWAHLIFSENALIRWRANFKHDGATRFSEVAGGLNMISIKRFVGFVNQSNFRFESMRAVPIRPLAWAHNRFTREFTSSVVECKLVKKCADFHPVSDRRQNA